MAEKDEFAEEDALNDLLEMFWQPQQELEEKLRAITNTLSDDQIRTMISHYEKYPQLGDCFYFADFLKWQLRMRIIARKMEKTGSSAWCLYHDNSIELCKEKH